jgi:ATP-dependent Lon protease
MCATGGLEQQAGTALLLLSGINAVRPQGSLCVSTGGSVGVFASVLPRGRGLRSITGSTTPSFLDAAQVAITWASLHAGWLRARGTALCGGGAVQRKGAFSRSGLHSPAENVAVSYMEPDATWKEGPSAGACTALALVQWLLRPLTTRGVVSVTGPINLRGFLLPAEGIEEKAGHARRAKAAMLIVSTYTYNQVGVWVRVCAYEATQGGHRAA